ncbi:MAG TPA: hypothetical protein VNZ58_01035 [Thermomicrobiales bacterium]|nr:hypothetical protein [Thermomicrobiales bacterium]
MSRVRIKSTKKTTIKSPTTTTDVEVWQTESGEWRERTRIVFKSTEATPEEIQYEISQSLRLAHNAARTEIRRRERNDIIEDISNSMEREGSTNGKI